MLHDPQYSGQDTQDRTSIVTDSLIRSTKIELLDVKAAGGIPSPRYNVFVDSPTRNMVAWTNIKNLLFNLTYPSLLNGMARPRKLFSCQICHSFAHPHGMCPLPKLLGWKGPKHEPTPPNHARAERGRGHGRRGAH